MTVKSCYSLPAALEQCKEAVIFTKLDFRTLRTLSYFIFVKRFVKEFVRKWKTAFSTSSGHYWVIYHAILAF